MDTIRNALSGILVPVSALLISGMIFGIFVALAGADPFETYALLYKGAFGSWFSWQNTLQRSAPFLLTALCTALPAQMGLVIIGGEGALIIGGLASVTAALAVKDIMPPFAVQATMLSVGMIAGAAWVGGIGALRHFRGVNEIISGLLLVYIAVAILNFLVEGVMRDPGQPAKSSTHYIGDDVMMGYIPGMEVHWGLVFGVIFCVIAYFIMYRTPFGFAARIVGGNPRAARMLGLSVGKLLVITCAIGGAAAGLAGAIEVGAVHGRANTALIAGYGFTGILVAFMARQNPLAIIPVAILFGGIEASGGLIQRRLELPNAAVEVLQGIIFIVVLAFETFSGRFPFLKKGEK
ncbi:MAG: ABC transporter permease [Rhodospirillales bacterium]|nr:ABC transporter permease [Rhodospirillales bacterium]